MPRLTARITPGEDRVIAAAARLLPHNKTKTNLIMTGTLPLCKELLGVDRYNELMNNDNDNEED